MDLETLSGVTRCCQQLCNWGEICLLRLCMFLITFQFSFLAARAEQALVEKPSALPPPPPRLKKHKHAEKNDSRGLQDRSDKDGLSVFTYFWFHTEDSSGGKPQGLPILGTSCFKATVFGGGGSGGCGGAVLKVRATLHL